MRIPRRPISLVLVLATVTAIVACATGGSASGAPVPRAPLRGTVLTKAEIVRAGAYTAYEAIEQLRPWYLSLLRTPTGSCERVVYVDGMRMGGLGELRKVLSESVREIRSVSAVDATTLSGIGHCAGAIVVFTRVAR